MLFTPTGTFYSKVQFKIEEEVEKVVARNFKLLFGDYSILLPKSKILTSGGKGTIPDGIIVDFKENRWFILEVERGDHETWGHIAPQISKQLVAVMNRETKNKIAELSDVFWNDGLVQNFETTAVNSPYINVYWATQVRMKDDALFTKNCAVSNLITVIGDVHHIFPKKYLQKNGINEKSKYNQVANYTYLDTPTNIAVGDDAPNSYFSRALRQIQDGCATDETQIGNITSIDDFNQNLHTNCIPATIKDWTYENYDQFLLERRKLMAQKIKEYYKGL